MVPEWPMRIGTISTLYPAALRLDMREECCVIHFSSWSSGLVSLQYLNSMIEMVSVPSAPFLRMMASGRELRPVWLRRKSSSSLGHRERTGAPSSSHFSADPRSAMTRSVPRSPFEMARRSRRPVELCRAVYMRSMVS